jgi:7-keto-8-aminopelargonate synthetase-like enzyme
VLGDGPIVPWVIGDAQTALELSIGLRQQGLDVRAVRPPTVPAGTARLRLTVTADHTPADLERALEAFVSAARRGL